MLPTLDQDDGMPVAASRCPEVAPLAQRAHPVEAPRAAPGPRRSAMNATEHTSDPRAKAGEAEDSARPEGSTQAHLAWIRTRMALETTLASWIRTATALIAFGFAIVQFFENYPVARGPDGGHLARYLGLVLIGIGTLETAIAIWEYRKVVRYLEGQAFQGIAGVPGLRRVYPAVVVAVLLCLMGLLAFFTILLGAELPWPVKPWPN